MRKQREKELAERAWLRCSQRHFLYACLQISEVSDDARETMCGRRKGLKFNQVLANRIQYSVVEGWPVHNNKSVNTALSCHQW